MRIAIRVDASLEIGSGHLVRCLALAGQLREKGAVVSFICRDLPGRLFHQVENNEFPLLLLTSPKDDSGQTAAILLKSDQIFDWLIVDHYAFDQRWESPLRERVRQLMVIDDLANRAHDCDLLLDQNVYDHSEHRYDGLVPDSCEQLLGPSFALLKPEFREARKNLRNRNGQVSRILVSFGGTDPTNETEKTLRALDTLQKPALEVDVVVGASNPHRERIRGLCQAKSNIHFHLQPSNMAKLISEAGLAIGAGGTSTWERLSMGLPSVVIAVAENQEEASRCLSANGSLLYLGRASEVTERRLIEALQILFSNRDKVISLSSRALEIVDALGTERVSHRLYERTANR